MSIVIDAFQPALLHPSEEPRKRCQVYVIGVGGAGCNTCNRLARIGVEGAHTVAINTDAQQLDLVHSNLKIQIGKRVTDGLGSGGDPAVGRKAIEESIDEVLKVVKDVDIAYIVTGLGGGTGTGAAPIVAKMCHDAGALVIGIVTLPFRHEGGIRSTVATKGLSEMRRYCNTVVVIQNDRLMELVPQLPVEDAFEIADQMMADMVKGVVEAISAPSIINIDFNDFRTIMRRGDVAVIGVGESDAPNRSEEAVREAMSCPLLSPIVYSGASGALIYIAGDETMTLSEAIKVGEIVQEFVSKDARIFWGPRIDPNLKGVIKVTLVLTGVRSSQLLPGFRATPELYNLEPYAGPEKPLGIDLELYQLK